MNAARRQTIGTSAKIAFLSTTHGTVGDGFDIDGCTCIIVTNHDSSVDLLVKIDGHHDTVANAPTGYGAAPAEADQWATVGPGVSIPFSVAKEPGYGTKISRMQLKSASGNILASWFVQQRR